MDKDKKKTSNKLACPKRSPKKETKKKKPKEPLTEDQLLAYSYTTIVTSKKKRIRAAAKKYLGMRRVPLLPGVEILDHQEDIIRWLNVRRKIPIQGINEGMVHADMGLGKTLGTMVYVLSNPKTIEENDIHPDIVRKGKDLKHKGCTLIVGSKTVLAQWLEQFEKFFGLEWMKENILPLHTDYIGKDYCKFEEVTKSMLCGKEIILTTYQAAVSGHKRYLEQETRENNIEEELANKKKTKKLDNADIHALLYKIEWLRIVLDESQSIANATTDNHKACVALMGVYKMCLSGTPIRNGAGDLLSQLKFLGLYPMPSPKAWDVQRFKDLGLEEVILSIDYEKAGIELKECKHHDVSVNLSDQERKFYDLVMTFTRNVNNSMAEQKYTQQEKDLFTHANILELILYLREICVRPDLVIKNRSDGKTKKSMIKKIEEIEEEHDLLTWLNNPNGTAGLKSAKTEALIELLNVTLKGEKAVVFSNFSSYLSLAKDYVEKKTGRRVILLDGSTNGQVRKEYIALFNGDIPGEQRSDDVLFVNYRVGGEGINIQKQCRNAIFMEHWWTYTVILQALRRIWRLHQGSVVHAYYLTARHTLEEHMIKICQEKVRLTSTFVGERTGLDAATLNRLLEPTEKKQE